LQSADNAEKFITIRKIDSFDSLAKFMADREQKYQELEMVHLSKGQKLSRLKELSKMYALYAPIQAAYKESQSLKGVAKIKYDKEHKDCLSKYSELKERMQSLLQNGEKITPKQWKAEIQSLQSECYSSGKEQSKTAAELSKIHDTINYDSRIIKVTVNPFPLLEHISSPFILAIRTEAIYSPRPLPSMPESFTLLPR